jgi:cytochrome P450
MKAGGLDIAKGTTVNIVPIVMGYRSEVFEKPFEFRPERWMENNTLPPYSYIPFSAGERGCIGQYLAKIETRIVMERIIKKYKFKARNPIKMKYQWIYETVYSDFDMAIKSECSE